MAPAQAYCGSFALRRDHLDGLLWIADHYPPCELWVWLRPGMSGAIAKLRERFDFALYKDPDWQTRSHARVRIVTARPALAGALAALNLQRIRSG